MPVRSPDAIGQVAPLGDDAVERRADLLSHFFASASLVVAGDSRTLLLLKYFRANASSRFRRSGSISSTSDAVAVGQQVEHDQQRGRLLRELLTRLAAG